MEKLEILKVVSLQETVNEAKEFACGEKYQIKAQTYTEEAKYTIDVNDFIKYANKED